MLASRVAPSIPPLVTLPIAGYLYERGVCSATVVAGILSIVLLILLAMFLREMASSRRNRTFIDVIIRLRDLLRDRFFLLLILAFGLDMLVKVWSGTIPIYLRSTGFTAVEYGLTMGLASLAVAIGALASGGMVDRLGPRYASTLGWLFATMVSMLFVYRPPLSLLMLFLWKVVGLLPRAVPPVVIARKYRDARASVLSAFNAALTLISLAGPTIIGIVASTDPALPSILRATTLLIPIVII